MRLIKQQRPRAGHLLHSESMSSLYIFMSRQGCIRAGRSHHSQPMTRTERAMLIAELTQCLAELMTAEERQLFPFNEHLADLVEELK